MGRLIDADALKREGWSLCRTFQKDKGTMVYEVKKPSDFPTIEERTGKWIRITQGATPEKYMCPFCHRTVEHEGVEYLVSVIYPFCHCGARMMQEGEDNG